MRRTVVALAIVVICRAAIAQVPADAIYTHPGTLLSAGTHKLNFYCMGSGSPTVILEGGFADWSPAFTGLQQRVAEFTRVCSYDRAGFGFSEAGPMPRSFPRIAEELHTALHNGGIDGPYLLVGLALGSGPVRVFADRWMSEVAGLVLINGDVRDAEAADMVEFWHAAMTRQAPRVRACREFVAAGKALPPNCHVWFFDGLPDSHFSSDLNVALEHEIATSTTLWDTLISELEEVPNGDAYLEEHQTSFGSRPLRIITGSLYHDTASTPSASRLEHMRVAYFEAAAQASLLKLSTNAKQIFSDTGPIVHLEKPELVADTIREAWTMSGSPRPSSGSAAASHDR